MTPTENLSPVYCTGPKRHPIGMWGGQLKCEAGTYAQMWGSPVKCGECGATCKAAS